MFPASRPSRGVVSCVALGLPGHPPKGVVPRYPPRGVLRDWSRPVPGSCRGGRVTPDRGFPPHAASLPQWALVLHLGRRLRRRAGARHMSGEALSAH